MKVLFVTLFLVAGAFARSAVPQNDVLAEGPACPIDDPLIRPGPLAINVTVDPVLKLLEGSQITNLVADGLSSLKYVINLNALLLTVEFEVTIERTSGNGTFTAEGYLDARPFSPTTIPSGNVTGGGLGKVAASGVRAKGSAGLIINLIGNKVNIRTLNIQEAQFDSLEVDLGQDITIGGSKVDWTELSKNIKANFDRELAANKAEITEKLRLAANSVVGKYTLQELIDIISGGGSGGEC